MLTRLHNVYVRGVGFFGQLGLNNKYQDVARFEPIPTLQHVELKKLMGSYCQSVALLGKNELLIWGWPLDVRSQMQVLWMLKDRTKLARMIQRYSPMPYLSLREGIQIPEKETEIRDAIVQVDIGGAFMTACDDQGIAYGWGACHRAQYGLSQLRYYPKPTIIDQLLPYKIVDVQCGYQHSLFRTSTGRIFGCGRCEYGEFGAAPLSKTTPFGHTKTVLEMQLSNITQMAAGQNHSVFLTDSGEVFATGKNEYGQCGELSSQERITEPNRVHLPEPAVQVSCGTKHTLVLGVSGTLYGLGGKRLGQIDGFRDGVNDDQCSPQVVKLPGQGKIKKIQAGFDRSCAFLDSGEVWIWGGEDNRYLGGEFYQDFTLLNDLLPEETTHGEITHVGLGFMHTLVGVMSQTSPNYRQK